MAIDTDFIRDDFRRAVLAMTMSYHTEEVEHPNDTPELDAIGVEHRDTLTFAKVAFFDDIQEAIDCGEVRGLLVAVLQSGIELGVAIERIRHEGLGNG